MDSHLVLTKIWREDEGLQWRTTGRTDNDGRRTDIPISSLCHSLNHQAQTSHHITITPPLLYFSLLSSILKSSQISSFLATIRLIFHVSSHFQDRGRRHPCTPIIIWHSLGFGWRSCSCFLGGHYWRQSHNIWSCCRHRRRRSQFLVHVFVRLWLYRHSTKSLPKSKLRGCRVMQMLRRF